MKNIYELMTDLEQIHLPVHVSSNRDLQIDDKLKALAFVIDDLLRRVGQLEARRG